ncbi:tetratricopeptide repeat-containing diguanylate cyclase [[Clostridium] dakarense]|uniref:tetratricopeptide repeat-containing diguanylate cyclase n=1 Tax=Faecalimicrobium dakarense TaxID=1301100 RepID=UPI0004B9EDF4|nr:tetratricopeptide repeat-containing diguanylate cyclase [[Clostridium] dakarense]
MKRRFLKKGVVFFTFIFIITILIFSTENKNKSLYTDKFINIIENNEEYNLDDSNIKFYKNKINNEIKNTIDNSILKKAYCSLGYIEFISGNYEKSNDYLLKSLNYKIMRKHKVQLMIYSGISRSYIALKNLDESYNYFKKAESLAKYMGNYNDLSSMYRSRAKTLINFNDGVGEAISLLEKALKLEQNEINKVENYLFISKLYMISDMFDLAVTYSNKAIEMAMENNFSRLVTEGLISLGTNYYSQDKYSRAITIYEKILYGDYIKTLENKLLVIGYLMDSYSKIEDYNKADKYMKEYLKEAKTLPIIKKNKELNWLYITVAEYKVRQGDIEESTKYLKEAKNIYERNEATMFSNTDIWMEKVELDIASKQSLDYIKVLNGYKQLLNKIEDRGIKSGIKDATIESIINISEKNNDYHTTLIYTNKKLDQIQRESNINLDTSADYSINKFENDIISKKVKNMKVRVKISSLIIISIVIIILIIYNKNKRIKKLNKELKLISMTDPLTGIFNKRFLYNQMEYNYKRRKEINFLMIDIDYFKLYNDNYGHLNGDNVLKEVAQILRTVFKDDIVSRYGGEEFSIISTSSREKIIEKTKELMTKLHNKNIIHEYSLISDRITLSIGIENMKICEENDIDKIIKAADEKLYNSKEHGRNRYTI